MNFISIIQSYVVIYPSYKLWLIVGVRQVNPSSSSQVLLKLSPLFENTLNHVSFEHGI